jgi:hypothetical protein
VGRDEDAPPLGACSVADACEEVGGSRAGVSPGRGWRVPTDVDGGGWHARTQGQGLDVISSTRRCCHRIRRWWCSARPPASVRVDKAGHGGVVARVEDHVRRWFKVSRRRRDEDGAQAGGSRPPQWAGLHASFPRPSCMSLPPLAAGSRPCRRGSEELGWRACTVGVLDRQPTKRSTRGR